ncbi:MAG TPA: hypothetical protein VKV15_02890 [Bryobacteraceae bacterium]|nr:hypothetical protein [Bryobacteraceae bacterium]
MRRAVVDWLACGVFTLIVGWQVMGPPIVGLANNGDFGKVLGMFGLTAPTENEFKFLSITYHWDRHYYFRSGYVTSEQLLASVAVGVSRPFMPPGMLDIRFIGAVHGALYLAAFYLLVPLLRGMRRSARIGVYAFLILVFSDTMYVSWLNTFYMDAAAMVFLLLSIVFYARAMAWNRRADLIGFAVCAALFAAAKLQHSPLAVVIAALAAITLPRAYRYWAPAVILAGAAVPMIFVESGYGAMAMYNTIFFEILPRSHAVDQDLADLGLDQSYRRWVGTHSFSEGSPMIDPAFSRDFSSRTSELKVLRYFLFHPHRTFEIIVARLNDAGQERQPMGTLERAPGRKDYARSNYFSLWSRAKAEVFWDRGRLWLSFLVLSWAGLFTALVRRRRSIYPGLCLAAMGTGALLIATLGDVLEVIRHLFLFTLLTDLTVVCAIVVAAVPQAVAHCEIRANTSSKASSAGAGG